MKTEKNPRCFDQIKGSRWISSLNPQRSSNISVRLLSAEMKQCDWMDVVGEGNLVDLLACLFLSSLATKLERTGILRRVEAKASS